MKRFLALVCCLLLAIIVAEVVQAPADGQAGHPGTDAGHVTDQAKQPVASGSTRLAQWQTAVLGRPLFAPGRKPAAGATTADAGLPRLTGVIASPGNAIAIFQSPGNGHPTVVRDGETIAGWQVMTIAGDRVSLQKASVSLVLQPAFGNAMGGGANVAAQPRSRWEVAATTGILRARWSNPQLQP